MNQPLWHLLQISDVLDMELASALAKSVALLAWEPQRRLLPALIAPGDEDESPADYPIDGEFSQTSFRVRQLPLLRGFARAPMSWFASVGPSVVQRLLVQTPHPEISPLICTTPFFAPVAELWPGPVIYWLTDLIAEYTSADRQTVHRLDRRMCRAATLVCPNSHRLERYLIDTAACDPGKIHVVPNATRISNVYPKIPTQPASLPPAVQHLARPTAGIIGNLAGNMDWLLLEQVISRTPWLTWVFVGPTTMHIPDRAADQARTVVMGMPNTEFVGRQPYGTLAQYARSFDVAVLPYRRCEPTYSGSSTRFYEHLAACRPMLATRGLEELTHKPPLLTLFDTAEECLGALNTLRHQRFDDGLLGARWHASRQGTWNTRAESMQQALAARMPCPCRSKREAETSLPIAI